MAETVRKTQSMYKQLRCCTALSGIREDSIRKIWDLGKVKRFGKGEVILRAKEDFSYIYFLLSGRVIQYNLTHLGKRKILFVLGPGALLNDHVFDSHASSIYCDAIEKCMVLIIPKDDYIKLMEKDFSLVRGTMSDQEKKMWRLFHQLKNTVGNIYMERKLAAKLWKLARDFGIPRDGDVEIDINMNVSFLADMLGVPRETASRTLKSLTDFGLIRHVKKRIIVCDWDGLAHFYKTGEIWHD